MSNIIDRLAAECYYSDEGGIDDEGNDLGSVDSLIEYKNALEDTLGSILRELRTAHLLAEGKGDQGAFDVWNTVAAIVKENC